MINTVNYEEKCWGKVAHLFDEEISVSLLQVNKGFCSSIHKHNHRWNSFQMMSGCMNVVVFRKEMDGRPVRWYEHTLRAGEGCKIRPTVLHRFEVIETGKVVEIYWVTDGTKIDINDIVRLDEGGKL